MTRTRTLFLILFSILLITPSCTNEASFHTVSFVTGNDTIKPSFLVKDGHALTADDLAAPDGIRGKVFSGWFLDGQKVEEGYRVFSDLVLHARWDDGTAGDSGNIQKGNTVILGYAFEGQNASNRRIHDRPYVLQAGDLMELDDLEGWYVDNKEPAYPGYAVPDDAVLVARFNHDKDGKCRVTFYSNIDGTGQQTGWDIPWGGSIAENSFQPLPEGASGWQTADGVQFDLQWPVYGDIDLYPVLDTVTVTFVVPDKGIRSSVEIPRGTRIPVPTGNGISYFLWYTDKDGLDTWDFNKRTFNDTTLYYLGDEIKTATVSYDASGYATDPEPTTVRLGTVLTQKELPTLSAPGMMFSGWRDKDGAYALAGQYKVVSDTTLYAQWTAYEEKGKITDADLTAGIDYISLSWTNPPDHDFQCVRIEISKNGSSFGMETVDIPSSPSGQETHVFTNLASGTEYEYRLYPVFYGGTTGEPTVISGIPSRYAGSEGWVYGITPPGQERWMTDGGTVRPYVIWKEGDLWFDVNKTHWADKESGQSPMWDSNLCWAAGASNVLHWWLNMNAENIRRYGKYDGPTWDYPVNVKDDYDSEASSFQTSAVFQYFISESFDAAGFDDEAVNWFINGYDGYIYSPIREPKSGGGFFKDVFHDTKLSKQNKSIGKTNFSQEMARALENRMGICYSAASMVSNVGHVMTIWGAGFDKQGYVSYLYTVDNNPSNDTPAALVPKMEKNSVTYGRNLEGATFAMIEYGEIGNYYKIQDFRLISLGEELWQEYFEKNGL